MSNLEEVKVCRGGHDGLSSDLVVQHNYLIQAKYDLSLQERRIIYWLVSQVRKDEEEFKEHRISIKEFCEVAEISNKNMYQRLAKITKELMQKILEIRSLADDSLEQIAWISYAKYLPREGIVVISFHPKMKGYLLDLKENFTKTSLRITFMFKSIYSTRIYEILKRYFPVKTKIINLVDLKYMFSIQEGKYESYKDFRRRILEPAQKEINDKSDIRFDFEEIKNGRKVVSIRFFINAQQYDRHDSLVENAEGLGINKSALDKVLRQYSTQEVLQGLLVLKSCTTPIKNPVQFLKRALQECWQPFEKGSDTEEKGLSIMDEIAGLSESEECKAIRKAFIGRQGEKEYKSWLATAEMKLEGSILRIGVKSSFTAQYIHTHYVPILKEMNQKIEYVEVAVRTDLDVPATKKEEKNTVDDQKVHRTLHLKKSGIVKKVTIPSQNKEQKSKKAPKTQQLPALKQLTLWGRVKTFFVSGN